MPETAPPPVKDFASMAIESMQTDPDAAPAKVEPVKVETKQPEPKQERGIPEGLFEKKGEEKKADPVVESGSEIDKIAEPNFRDPKNKGGWDTLKSKAKDLESKYADAQKKLADLEAKGKSTADIEAKLAKMEKDHAELQAKYAEADGTIKKRWIEDDPEYRKTFIDGRTALISEAKSIVDESGLDGKSIESALNLKGRPRIEAIEQAADGMSTFQQGRLAEVVSKLNRLDAEAEAKRGNPEQYLKERQQQEYDRQVKETEQHQQSMSKAFRDGMREVSSESVGLQKLVGEDFGWWNQKIDGDFQTAQKMWESGLQPKEAAKMLILGIASKRIEEAFVDTREQRNTILEKFEKAKAELEKIYSNGAPKISGGSGGDPKGGKPMDFASRVIDTAQIK